MLALLGAVILLIAMGLMTLAHSKVQPERGVYAVLAWCLVFLGLMGIGAGLC